MTVRPALVSALVILAVPAAQPIQVVRGRVMTVARRGPRLATPRPTTPDRLAAAASAPSHADTEQAAALWDTRCSACHGADGRGDGPGAVALKPRPIDFHRANWQSGVTDEQIAKAIVEGGAAVGLSNQMPPNPDLEDESGMVAALVARVRAYGTAK